MELRHLRYFVAVGEEQHFGRAARACISLSQPYRGRSKIWRRRLDSRLFDRLPRGVRLNAAGTLFLNDVRRILQDVEGAKRRAERVALGKGGHASDRNRDSRFVARHGRRHVSPIPSSSAGRGTRGASSALCSSNRRRVVGPTGCRFCCQHDTVAQGVGTFAIRGRQDDACGAQRPCADKAKTDSVAGPAEHPFIWFQRWVNPAFYDQMMQACARGGLSAPRIVQEAPDRDTQLGLVQCRIGIAWLTESTRWHCPRGVVLLPVVDMHVRLCIQPDLEEGQFVALAAEICRSGTSVKTEKIMRANAMRKSQTPQLQRLKFFAIVCLSFADSRTDKPSASTWR